MEVKYNSKKTPCTKLDMIKEKIKNASNWLIAASGILLSRLMFAPKLVYATAPDNCPTGFEWVDKGKNVKNPPAGSKWTAPADGCYPSNGTSSLDTSGQQILKTLSDLSKWVTILAVAIGVIYTVYSGIKIMTSSGNPQKREMAKQSLISVLIGLAIVGGASLIASVAFGLLAK